MEKYQQSEISRFFPGGPNGIIFYWGPTGIFPGRPAGQSTRGNTSDCEVLLPVLSCTHVVFYKFIFVGGKTKVFIRVFFPINQLIRVK